MIKICVQPSFQDWILVMSVVTDVKVNLNEAFLLLEQNMKVSVTLCFLYVWTIIENLRKQIMS